MSETPSVTPETRRNRRLRLACARCQKRKIRCDAQYPTCNNCKKASVVCTDGDSLRLRDIGSDDDVVAELRSHVAQLESTLRERETELAIARQQLESAAPAQSDIAAVGDDATLPTAQNISRRIGPALGNGDDALSHEIGMVSVNRTSAPRYIGPSSGFFMSRLIVSASFWSSRKRKRDEPPQQLSQAVPTRQWLQNDLVSLAAQPAESLPELSHAQRLCEAYFDAIHPQYPFLHEPTFMKLLEHVYTDSSDDVTMVHVYMVLALGATVITHRRKVPLPSESYCASAFERLEKIGNDGEQTIPGLQCLLLLNVYAMYNPHIRVNVWYLNYRCIATALDLGLQRNIAASSQISLFEQEMRTRIFWVVFTLDRTIATIMGRPIGIRDEACDLRYPQPIDDNALASMGLVTTLTGPATDLPTTAGASPITYSIHLFKLARLNSEIKYVANSINRAAPRYAYPPPTDMLQWQADVLSQLDDWAQQIPRDGNDNLYISTSCEIRYNLLVMLLMRPSPAIPNPPVDCLRRCYASCKNCINLLDRLYRADLLVYSWTSFHGVLLSLVTMLYCLRASPTIASRTDPGSILSDAYLGLNILSAAGEYWPGAKRSRNVLHDVVHEVVRWTTEAKKMQDDQPNLDPNPTTTAENASNMAGTATSTAKQSGTLDPAFNLNLESTAPGPSGDFYFSGQNDATLGISSEEWFTSPFDESGMLDIANIDSLMHSFFTDSPGNGIF